MGLKYVIVGGESSQSLADFITDNAGGSIEIPPEYRFKTFSGDREALIKSFIRADDLIYLMDESPNIKADFSVIYELLKNPALFGINTMWIFAEDNDVNTQGLKQLESILAELDFTSYNIRTYGKDELGFQDIYREITGLVSEERNPIEYAKVYRVRRDEDGNRGYDPELFDKNIELKSTDGYSKYEEVKESAIKAETGRIIETGEEDPKPEVDLNIDEINVQAKTLAKNIIVVSGFNKSGVSAFATRLSKSLFEDRNVNLSVIDLSTTCGSARNLLKYGNNVVSINNKDFVLGHDYSDSKFNVFKCPELKEDSDKITFLKYIRTTENRHVSDFYVIDCDISLFKNVLSICNLNVKYVFLCTESNKDDAFLLKPYVELCKDKEVYIYANDNSVYSSYTKCTPNDIKEILGDVSVIKSLNLNKAINLSQLVNLGVS